MRLDRWRATKNGRGIIVWFSVKLAVGIPPTDFGCIYSIWRYSLQTCSHVGTYSFGRKLYLDVLLVAYWYFSSISNLLWIVRNFKTAGYMRLVISSIRETRQTGNDVTYRENARGFLTDFNTCLSIISNLRKFSTFFEQLSMAVTEIRLSDGLWDRKWRHRLIHWLIFVWLPNEKIFLKLLTFEVSDLAFGTKRSFRGC